MKNGHYNKIPSGAKSRGKILIIAEEISICPVCGKELHVIGSRERKIIETDATIKVLIIRRLRCRECNKIHHELPDIVVPYKRHCGETVENIITGQTDKTLCEESTIRRILAWWALMLTYFQHIIESLETKYGIKFSNSSKPREIVRAVANANFWVHTRSAFLSG